MLTDTEVLDPQTEVQEEPVLSPEEVAELKKRAEVSSQNFERAKKAEAKEKELQEKVKTLEEQLTDNTGFIDPDANVRTEIEELKTKFARLEEEKDLSSIFIQYPALREKQEEFDEYRRDFPASKIGIAAKAFLAEKDLLDVQTPRKGLEPARGGKKTPPQSGKMSADDVKRLRTENYSQYIKLLRTGKIEVE